MKKIFLISGCLFMVMALQAQKSYFTHLKDWVYTSLENPDFTYTKETLPKEASGLKYVNLNFTFPGLQSSKLYLDGHGLRVGDLYNAKSIAVNILNFMDDQADKGISLLSDSTEFKVTYLTQGNEPIGTQVELTNLVFENFPSYTFNYQAFFYKSGVVQVNFGPNNFNASFPDYTQSISDISFTEFDGSNLNTYDFVVLSQNPRNPMVNDLSDALTAEDVIPFWYIPNNDLSFSINTQPLISSVQDVSLDDVDISIQNNQLLVKNLDVSYSIYLYTTDGKLLSSKRNLQEDCALSVEQFSGIIIAKIVSSTSTKVAKFYKP